MKRRMKLMKIARIVRGVGGVVLLGVVGAVIAADDGAKPGAAELSLGAREILTQHCVKCHGGEKTKGEFDLTTREGLLHPGAEGPNVVPGTAKAPRLRTLVRH